MPRGADVARVNREIRTRVRPGAAPIEAGDVLVCSASCNANWWRTNDQGELETCEPSCRAMLYSGLEYTVEEVLWAHNPFLGVNGYMARLSGYKGVKEEAIPSSAWFQIILSANKNSPDPLDPASVEFQEHRRTRQKDKMQQEKTARETFAPDELPTKLANIRKAHRQWINDFIPFQYAYAYTVHKAQGKSLDAVYMSRPTLFTGASSWENMVYVAFTRARKHIRVSLS